VSDWFRDFLAFAPNTTAGDWAWVTLAWLVTIIGFGGYQLWLMRRRARLRKEQLRSTAS